MKALVFFLLVFGVEFAFAQIVSPSPSPAVQAAPSGVVAFILQYKAVLAGLVVAILDLVMALNPKIAGNGLLHWVLVQANVVKGQDVQPSSPQQPPAA